MTETKKPRQDIIKVLSNAALEAMEEMPVENLTVNEVVSACYTLTRHVTQTLMADCIEEDREKNRMQLISAIADLYAIVQPPANKLN